MPSESELNKLNETTIKLDETVTRIQSAIDMCDRRIGLGENSLEATCNEFIKVFDKHMRPFFTNNNRTINLAIYPETISQPWPTDSPDYKYWFTHFQYTRELLKIFQSCEGADETILNLCITLFDDALLKYQEAESEASQFMSQIILEN